MMTPTERSTVTRLIQVANTIVNHPPEGMDAEVAYELEVARTATAALFYEYVDDAVVKLDVLKDAMHGTGSEFVPEKRKGYGPIFDAEGVYPEDYQAATEAEFTSKQAALTHDVDRQGNAEPVDLGEVA